MISLIIHNDEIPTSARVLHHQASGQGTQITMDEFMEDITKEAELDIPPFLRRAVSNGNGRTGTY